MPTASLPTAQELLATNESKQLYRTNLLRLQLDELHRNVAPVYEKLAKVDTLLALLKEAISHVTETSIPADCSATYPQLHFHKASLTPFDFRAPVTVEVVGSYKNRTMVRPLQTIDMAMVIAPACFSEKEFKSFRYFDRRTAYCGELAKQLSAKMSTCEFSVDYWNGDRNKAVVLATVPNSQWRIRLIPCLTPTTFPISKLGPSYKNLSESTVCDPLYNASILEDMYLTSDIFTSPKTLHFARAVELVKVWLYRRKALVTERNTTGLSGFHIRVIMSHLCSSQNLPKEISAYQLLKLFVSLMSKTEWSNQVLVYGSTAVRSSHPGLPSPIMEVPQMASYNPLFRVPLSMIAELSAEAKQSLSVLDDVCISDPYEFLFSPQSREKDITIRVERKVDQSPLTFDARHICDQVEGILKEALGKRLYKSHISVRYDLDSVTLTGDIDSSTATSLIDKGPSADSPEAGAFKAFWGRKAELRRFRDGSILECVVWNKECGISVAEQIIEYVNETKLGSYDVETFVTPLGACQPINANHIELWSSLETLRTKLTSIPSLPIAIVNLRPSHGRFTSTDLSAGVLQPLDCTIEFESSKAWPANRIAVWHTKCAFLLAICEGLMKQYCAVEIAAEEYSEEPFIDVRMQGNKTPYSFRIRIFANVELERLSRAVVSPSSPPTVQEIHSVGQLWFSPMLRVRIHALSAQCPAISGAITAAKEWMDNRLLLEPWLGDWVEVSMAHLVEAGVAQGRMPQSPHVLFLEWLFFVANHPYKTEPIIAKLGGESEAAVLRAKYDQAVDTRKSWWISSDIDPDCLFLRRPNELEATRIQSIAKATLAHADAREYEKIRCGTDNGKIFDIILTMNKERVANIEQIAKTLSEQFRKYASVHYSKRHRLVALRLESGMFKPQSNASVKTASMLTIVDDLAIPDVVALTTKLAALLNGSVESVRVRS